MLTIHLADEQESALRPKAEAEGIAAEQHAQQVLERAIEPAKRKHISEVIRERISKVQPEIMAALPTDGASQLDHYIYGLPKREE
jgi:uncharacterized protein (UPF0261 family)